MDSAETWIVGLGLVVRRRRLKSGVTQERFAQYAELTRNQIQHIESGRTSLALNNLVKVATALETDAATLLTEVRDLIRQPAVFAAAKTEFEGQRKRGRPKG